MEFKVVLLCFAVVVSVCKCEDKKETVSKYKLKLKDGDKEVDEEIDVDTEKQTETYHIPKTDSSNVGDVDVVYDFKKNLTMQRLSAAKACFLSESTEDMPKPTDLVKLLDQQSSRSTVVQQDGTVINYNVVSTVTDRSNLSDEMASMCAKLPIYRIKKTMNLRVKRGGCKLCFPEYYACRKCTYWPRKCRPAICSRTKCVPVSCN